MGSGGGGGWPEEQQALLDCGTNALPLPLLLQLLLLLLLLSGQATAQNRGAAGLLAGRLAGWWGMHACGLPACGPPLGTRW